MVIDARFDVLVLAHFNTDVRVSRGFGYFLLDLIKPA
jgi:hypothetical protein